MWFHVKTVTGQSSIFIANIRTIGIILTSGVPYICDQMFSPPLDPISFLPLSALFWVARWARSRWPESGAG